MALWNWKEWSGVLDKLVYLLLFAVSGALLYVWGLVKSIGREQELTQLLFDKGSRIVKKNLRGGRTLCRREAEVVLQDLQVKPFGSRHGSRVTNPSVFTQTLLEMMVQRGIIRAEGSGAATRYQLCIK